MYSFIIYQLCCHLGIIALVNGNKNMENTIEAAYEAIIPTFKNFEAANTPKVFSYITVNHA